jgi:hypothetical protein
MAAASNRIYTFFLMKEPGRPDRIVVWDTQEITFGRASDNDLCVDHAEVSRHHAQFVRSGKSYAVQNLNMSNGTLVNGEEVKTQVLKSRDAVKIADVEFTFFQTTKDPVSSGIKVEYASQFKEFGGPSVSGGDAEATMLGLVDTVSGSDDDFEIRPAGDFTFDLNQKSSEPVEPRPPRDLDAELDDFGLDDLDISDMSSPPAAPSAPRAQAAPEATKPTAAPSAAGTLSLNLEIQGLTGELRQTLAALLGKTVSLPPLKIRIKSDDLG